MAAVTFDGLSRTTENAVRATVDLVDERCDAPEARVRRQFRRADGEIRTALEVYGYYAPTIDGTLSSEGKCWQARFVIDRGPRVQLRDVRVDLDDADGEEDRALRRALLRHPFERGAGLNQREYEAFKESVMSLARQRGYFDGRFGVSRIDVYPDALAADVTLEFDPGRRYRFGTIGFDQDVVKEDLPARYLDFESGDAYDAEHISSLYTALLVSGYFESIDIRTTLRPAPDHVVDVHVALTAADPKTWTTGIGYATDTGPQVRMGYINRRRNERGHQFELNSSFSEVIGETTASYRIPLDSPRDEWRSFDTGYKYEDPESADSRQFKIGVKEIRHRGSRGWIETRFLEYSRERFTIGEQRATTDLVVPGVGWSHRTTRLPMRPTRAHFVSLQASGTTEAIGSDTSFVQLETHGRLIWPLWRGGRVLTRVEAGTTFKDQFEDLPFSVRYFAGGDYSVRGYDYKSLGPTDDEGTVIGGSHKLTASVEFDQRIRPNWSAALFVDTGNAFDSWDNATLKTGVGAGIRWYSPLGPIRFDVAVPLDSDAPDSFRIHITLGPDL